MSEQAPITGWTPRKHRQEDERSEQEIRKMRIRNWLNIIFMVLAVIGVGYYLLADKTIGMYIVLTAMSVKIVEASMRMVN